MDISLKTLGVSALQPVCDIKFDLLINHLNLLTTTDIDLN